MASHRKLQTPAATPRELIDVYSGVGKTFRVKFVGSENISKQKGDAVAIACLKSIRLAQQQLGYHKPKAVLGLNTKGLSLFDERTKANTRVAISKVQYLTHDPEDICYFGVVIMTNESPTGLKLYAFKAEKQIAVQFVKSAKDLFDLMFRLSEAKKRVKERKEQEAASATTADQNTQAPRVVAGIEAPPDYHVAVEFQKQEDENPPPVPPRRSREESVPSISDELPPMEAAANSGDERRQKVLNEWSKLEDELNDIAKELQLETEKSPQHFVAGDHIYAVPNKSRPLSPGGQFSDDLLSLDPPKPATTWSSFDTTEAQSSLPFTSTPTTASQSVQQSISLHLNPFSTGQSASTFDSGMSGEFSNPLYTSDTVAFPTTSSPTSPEPNITMDLLDNVLSSPMPSNPFAPSPPSMQQPYPMASPFQGPQFQAPYGQPQVVAGGPMGPPFSVMGSIPFQQTQPAPSTDLLSSPPSESLFGFSQPLQPVTIATSNTSAPPKKVDAFADLVSIARKSGPEQSTGATPPPPPIQKSSQQKQYVPMNKMAAEKNQPAPLPTPPPFGQFLLKKTASPHQPIVDNAFDVPSSSASPGFDHLSPDSSFGWDAVISGGAENQQASRQSFDDIFGDPISAFPQQPLQATPVSGFNDSFGKASSATKPGWVGFEDEEKGQWL